VTELHGGVIIEDEAGREELLRMLPDAYAKHVKIGEVGLAPAKG
jgi:hypothetical protein